MDEVTHVWIVNRSGEFDPLYVFVDDDQAREYAARYPDAEVGEEVVMSRSAGAQFLIDTYEPEDEEPDDHSSRKEDARNEANGLVRVLERGRDDAAALDAIAHMLQDPDWGVGMLEDIAAIVSDSGRSLDNPSEEQTWHRH